MNAATKRKRDSAVYVTCKSAGLTFRLGQPVDWLKAQARFDRVDGRLSGFSRDGRGALRAGIVPKRTVTIRHDGRQYTVDFAEVRTVDDHGRGLGSDRHTLAFPVPYRSMRVS